MGLLTPRQPRVDRLRRRGDVAGLCEALSYRDRVRLSSGEMVDLGGPVRRKAIAALREIDDDRATAAAAEALADDDETVRLEATRMLRERRISDPIVECLVRSSSDLPESVRTELRAALLELDAQDLGVAFAGRLIRDGDHATIEAEDGVFLERLLAGAAAADRRELARVAVDELANEDEARRGRAFAVVSALGEDGVGALRAALQQPHRAEAAAALGRLRDSSALPALLDLLGDEQAPVRASAARALGEIRDPRAVEGLLAASTDTDFVVRDAAGEALNSLGTSAIVFAVAAFVRPLLADRTAEHLEPASAVGELTGGAEELHTGDASRMPVQDSTPKSPAPSALDRLRRAARRARTGRRAP